jgi:hypothetical protein
VFDGPHAAAPQHGACHAAFRSILAHINKPLAPLHQHYLLTIAEQWACVACRFGGLQTRRPAAYSSVGLLGRESEAWDVRRGSLLGFVWAKARAIRSASVDEVNIGDHVSFDTVRLDRQLRSGRDAGAELALYMTYLRFPLSPWLLSAARTCVHTVDIGELDLLFLRGITPSARSWI